jgi:pimeloyl-ACP methyl ester carboxylesterase
MRRSVPVAAAVVILALAGCSTSPAAQSPAAPSSGSPSPAGQTAPVAGSLINWHNCAGGGGQLRCGSLQVPLDYTRPGGRKITLALSEVPATAPAARRQGALLLNPGGPGGSGLAMTQRVAGGLDPAVAADYDIIGFDTRGVGSSVPAITCDPSFFAGVRPDYIPATKAAEQVLIGRAKAYAASCQRRYGWLLPYLTTANIARDMDSIRAALGQQKISYFAYSYGTYIGQVYATLFPARVKRMVLDSTVDPDGVWYADNISQDYAFQGRIKAFFAWAASNHAVYRLGTTPAQVSTSWYQARNRLKAHPVSGPSGPMIGADEFDDTFLTGGYADGFWPLLATALSSYLHTGATSQLVSVYEQAGKQNDNEFAVYNAVECADVGWPRNWARWDADTRKVYAKAPFEAWDNAWFNAACAFWPVHGPATPMRIGAPNLPPILMLQGTLDAATPYAGAQAAHRLLPSARMVVVTGGGNHGQSLSSPPNSCVDGYLNAYLSTGALPSKPGLVNGTCPALPAPTPGG